MPNSPTRNLLTRINAVKGKMLRNLLNIDRSFPVAAMNIKNHPHSATSIVLARHRVRMYKKRSKNLTNELNRLRLQLRRRQNAPYSPVKKM
jgi:hypothetical protein